MVNQRSGHAGSQGSEEIFHRIGPFARSQQQGRFIRIQLKSCLVAVVLLDAEKIFNSAAVVAAVEPFIIGAEFEFGDDRTLFNRIDRIE